MHVEVYDEDAGRKTVTIPTPPPPPPPLPEEGDAPAAAKEAPKLYTVTLTEAERELLLDALDSHTYWQLSDERYRSSGYVLEPGSDDEENAAEIEEAETLQEKLRTAPAAAEEDGGDPDSCACHGVSLNRCPREAGLPGKEA